VQHVDNVAFSASTGNIAVSIEGQTAIGAFGNCSFGALAAPLRGTSAYKTATTEDGAAYTSACALGDRAVIEGEEWPHACLTDGINITGTALGQCR